jgi:flagellar biosynthesis/type III secretory pathway protein FliH
LDETRLDYTGSRGQFIDPNLDPTRLADVQRLPGHIADTRLAPEDPSQDIYRNYVSENLIAAPSLAEDEYYGDVSSRMLAEGAAGQGVYGEEFMESPGYAFQLEEMNRALDRRNSAGGNYGGEALREAMRQAQGLAAQDYYNWAQGRTQDLIRRGSAEATDAGRLDRAAESHVQRGIMDVNREDSAMLNYLARRETDTARMDTAISEADRLEAADIARGDQAYYNYLANTGRVAGFSDAAGQAVNASQNQAAMISNVYGRQGDIYAQRGENEANIAMNLASNINDAGQSAINNYMLYQYLQ